MALNYTEKVLGTFKTENGQCVELRECNALACAILPFETENGDIYHQLVWFALNKEHLQNMAKDGKALCLEGCHEFRLDHNSKEMRTLAKYLLKVGFEVTLY